MHAQTLVFRRHLHPLLAQDRLDRHAFVRALALYFFRIGIIDQRREAERSLQDRLG